MSVTPSGGIITTDHPPTLRGAPRDLYCPKCDERVFREQDDNEPGARRFCYCDSDDGTLYEIVRLPDGRQGLEAVRGDEKALAEIGRLAVALADAEAEPCTELEASIGIDCGPGSGLRFSEYCANCTVKLNAKAEYEAAQENYRMARKPGPLKARKAARS